MSILLFDYLTGKPDQLHPDSVELACFSVVTINHLFLYCAVIQIWIQSFLLPWLLQTSYFHIQKLFRLRCYLFCFMEYCKFFVLSSFNALLLASFWDPFCMLSIWVLSSFSCPFASDASGRATRLFSHKVFPWHIFCIGGPNPESPFLLTSILLLLLFLSNLTKFACYSLSHFRCTIVPSSVHFISGLVISLCFLSVFEYKGEGICPLCLAALNLSIPDPSIMRECHDVLAGLSLMSVEFCSWIFLANLSRSSSL